MSYQKRTFHKNQSRLKIKRFDEDLWAPTRLTTLKTLLALAGDQV